MLIDKQTIEQINRKADIDGNIITHIAKESQEIGAYCIILNMSWIYRRYRRANWQTDNQTNKQKVKN